MIRERRQYLSQLRSFRDEPLGQTRPRKDERWSRTVTTALLLHCVRCRPAFVPLPPTLRSAGLRRCRCRTRRRTRFCSFRSSCLSITPVRAVDAAQKLLGFCFLRPSAPVPPIPALALASAPQLPSPHSSVCDVLVSLALVLSSRRLSAPPTSAPCARLRLTGNNLGIYS